MVNVRCILRKGVFRGPLSVCCFFFFFLPLLPWKISAASAVCCPGELSDSLSARISDMTVHISEHSLNPLGIIVFKCSYI